MAAPPFTGDTAPQDGAGNPNFNFIVYGVPATIRVIDTPGTFVLITPAAYNAPPAGPASNAYAPPVGAVAGAQRAYSAVIGPATDGVNGQADINVASGFSYFVTCWKGNARTSDISGPVNGVANTPLVPQTNYPTAGILSCP